MSASMNVLPLRSSLLNRRAATHNPAVPINLSVPALVPFSPPAPATFSRPNPRRPSAGILSFTPLPPIMASPTLTPEVAHASSSAAGLDTTARKLVPGHANTSTIAPAPPEPAAGDYVSHHPFPPNPTWTTCPPTPPPKGPSSSRLTPATPPSPARAADSQRNAHADRTSPRPASVEREPVLTASPSLIVLSNSGRFARASARRYSLPVDLSKPLPPRPEPHATRTPEGLPPLPLAPIDRDRGGLEESLLPSLSRRAPMIQGVMSLTPRVASAGPAACETGVGRRVGRKLFNLDAEEGDASDEEDAEHLQGAYKVQKKPARGGDAADLAILDPDPDTERDRETTEIMGRARGQEQQRERVERLRRYHALMELLTTEVGYLFDLRALVTVYLDQLLLLSTPTSSPGSIGPSSLAPPPLVASPQQSLGVAPPGRSMSTFSALSIPSLFPSSRSSFLQPSPLPTPSVSADYLSNSTSDCGSLQERERHTSCPPPPSDNGSREREREGPNRILTLRHGKSRAFGPLLVEKEAQAICRNAQDLLRHHERFVGELRDAVSVTSFRVAFEEGSGGQGSSRTQRADEVATEEVEGAIELVAARFVKEAASFCVYETFCPGHNAAGDVVRRVQERAPSAWDAYEQRCALLASNVSPGSRPDETKEEADLSPTSPTSTEMEHTPPLEPFATVAKRRHSTPIGFPSSASSLPDGTAARSQLPFPTSSPSSATFALPTPERKVRWTAGHKLKLTDFLIKPVQRICKYPLLLDQLKDKRYAQSVSDDEREDQEGNTLRRATEAMREMTSRVNRASEKEAHNLRSALIHSRLVFTNPPLSSMATAGATHLSGASSPSSSESSHGHSNPVSMSSYSSAPTSPSSAGASHTVPVPVPPPAPGPRLAYLTADFVSSLGPCLLAGALDVVQHPVQRAKYLGAFLYAGGYCILAKIPKGGRVYEPRHWFALSEVEVVDIEEDDPLYPYTFRVSGYGHHLQLAASCSQEKAIWMAVINDALSTKRTWAREPFSSLQVDDRSPTITHSATVAVVEDPLPDDSLRRLSTIQSNSELEKESEMSHETTSTYPSPVKLRYSKTMFRLDGIPGVKPEHHYSQGSTFSAALSRRSSTASVKAFFAPIAFDLRIARPNGQVRGQVESGLHDVFSESCLAVRAQAQMRGEELFQVVRVLGPARGRQQATVPRSSSGISLASAMGFSAAKRKYDNVLVSRRKSSVDLDMQAPPVPALPGYATTSTLTDTTGPAPSESGGLSFRSKTLAARRQKRLPSSIAPAISTAIAQMNAEQQERPPAGPLVQSPDPLTLDSPPGVSRCSSVSSVLPSPVDTSPLPIPTPGVSPSGTEPSIQRGRDAVPKRSRSVVDNVRSLFHSPRSRSPSSSSGRASPSPALTVDTPSSSDSSNSIVQWLRRASLRRTRTSASSSSAHSIVDGHFGHGHGESHRRMTSRMSTDSVAMPNQYLDVPSPRSRGTRDHCNRSPKRHRSLFVSSTSHSRANEVAFRDDTMREKGALASSSTTSSSSLAARRSLKNLLLFQRANAMTPVDVGPSHSR